jgi:hypothetical protein
MPKRSLMLVAGLFALLFAGCGSEEGGDTASKDGTSPTPSASPSASSSPTGTQSFKDPLVSEKKSEKDKKDKKDGKDEKDPKKLKKRNAVPGLLASTDPDERARQVQQAIRKGRTVADPFASLPPILTFKTPVVASSGDDGNESKRSVPALPELPGGIELRPIPRIPTISRGNNIARGGFPNGGSTRGGFPNGGSSGFPNGGGGSSRPRPISPPIAIRPPSGPGGNGTSIPVPAEPLKPLPPIPEPTLAKGVEVSGVVTIGGVTQAIVKAPNEPTSRYVGVGARLSNGLVLVKRIEVNAGSDPVVILEQGGVEVSRAVGDKPAPATGQPPVPPSA